MKNSGKHNRKNLYDLVKISNRLSGRSFTTGVVKRFMGYSKNTRFYSTNGCHFVKSWYNNNINSNYPIYEFGSWILTPNFPKLLVNETQHPRFSKRLFYDGFTSNYFEREKLHLLPRGAMPFYLLKEYGGKY